MKSHTDTRDHSLRPGHGGWLRSLGLAMALALLAIAAIVGCMAWVATRQSDQSSSEEPSSPDPPS